MVSNMLIDPKARSTARKAPRALNRVHIPARNTRSPTIVSMTNRGLIYSAERKPPTMLRGTNCVSVIPFGAEAGSSGVATLRWCPCMCSTVKCMYRYLIWWRVPTALLSHPFLWNISWLMRKPVVESPHKDEDLYGLAVKWLLQELVDAVKVGEPLDCNVKVEWQLEPPLTLKLQHLLQGGVGPVVEE